MKLCFRSSIPGFGVLPILFLTVSLTACGGSSSGPGESSIDANSSVAVFTRALNPGDLDCPYGGITVHTGIDDNGNGLLDDSETDLVQKVCNGEPGLSVLVETTDESAGLNCSDGGIKIETGIDLNNDNLLSATEIANTEYVCNGVDISVILDSDNDGLSDALEVNVYQSDPNNPDSDGDGMRDGEEILIYGSSPTSIDSDSDGLGDFSETRVHLTDPTRADTDSDGLTDEEEVYSYPTNPLVSDSDSDGLLDGAEVNQHATDPVLADSDEDGVSDGDEVVTYLTDPLTVDSDGDTAGDGIEIDAGTNPNDATDIPPGYIRWSYDLAANSSSTPALDAGGAIYVGADNGLLYVFNPDGSLKWTYDAGSPIQGSVVLSADGVAYLVTQAGNLHAVNADGSFAWSHANVVPSTTPALAVDGSIYAIGYNRLWALNSDGSIQWEYYQSGLSSGLAVGGDGRIYALDRYGIIYAVNADGSAAWTYASSASSSSPQSISIGGDGSIYTFGNEYYYNTPQYLYSVKSDGGSKWRRSVRYGIDSIGSAIGAGGNIYFQDSEGLYAYDTEANAIWSNQGIGGLFVPALGADGSLIVGAIDHFLYRINGNGSIHWAFSIPGGIASSAAVGSEGTIYVNGNDGRLYAVADDSGGLAITAWPKRHKDGANNGRMLDSDGDGLSDSGELTQYATDPGLFDSDGDGLGDGDEVSLHGTDPLMPDSDGDTLSDFDEINIHGTDPLNVDSDADQLSDAAEINTHGTDPLNVDSDQDTMIDGDEINLAGTDPLSADSDGDGDWDGREVTAGSDPLNSASLIPEGWPVSWSFRTSKQVITTIAVDPAGVMYFGDTGGRFYALNPDGSLKWDFDTGSGEYIYSSASIADDGSIYFGSVDGNLYALNPDGTLQWSFASADEIRSTPAIGVDGSIYFGSFDHNVYALNPDGSLKWSFATESSLFTDSALGPDGTLYIYAVIGGKGGILALDTLNGSQIWHAADVRGNKIVIGDGPTLYLFSSGLNSSYSYETWLSALRTDGTLRWENYLGNFSVPGGLVVGLAGRVHMPNGRYVSLDGQTNFAGPTGSLTPIIGSDFGLYAANNGYFNSQLIGSGADLITRWTLDTPVVTGPPILAQDGNLYAAYGFEIYPVRSGAPGTADLAWPTYMANLQHHGRVKDTDGDGLLDQSETGYNTDPLIADSDGDGLLDGEEVVEYLSDPLLVDSDGDGFDDYAEILAGTDPLDPLDPL